MASSLHEGRLRKMADRLCCCFVVVENEEMEIGSPTDVKHVVHIGWDGPSANGPTWRKEFSNVPEFQSSLRGAADLPGLNSDGDQPSIRLGIENLMGGKSNSSKLMDHATDEEVSSMTKKLKWNKIKSMSSKSSRSSRRGNSKTDIQSIAVAA